MARFERRLVDDAPPLARIADVESTAVGRPLGEPGSGSSRAGPAARRGRSCPPTWRCATTAWPSCSTPADRRYRYPVHQLHQLRPPVHHHRPAALRPAQHDHGRLRAVPGVRRRVRRPGRPALPRPAGRLRRLRAPDLVRVGRRRQSARSRRRAPLAAAPSRRLARGEIVAVKGLGGYHLACDATSATAVAELRRRKAPAGQAVRGDGRATWRGAPVLALRRPAEARLLDRARSGRSCCCADGPASPLSALVAPGNPYVGVLLPYTPLHHLLFRPVPGVDAPVPDGAGDDQRQPERRADLLRRRRRPAAPRAASPTPGWSTTARSTCPATTRWSGSKRARSCRSAARGLRPAAGAAAVRRRPRLLAAGGELKNTFCLAAGRDAWMSQHIGDMGSVETLAAFERSTRQFARHVPRSSPERVAADCTPGYQTRRWAEDTRREQRRWCWSSTTTPTSPRSWPSTACPPGERVIGFAFDGTGLRARTGPSGAARSSSPATTGSSGPPTCATCRCPGGDATIRKPYRAALAHLWAAGIDWAPDLAPVRAAPAAELHVLRRQLERGVRCVADVEHGPAVRRRQLAARAAPHGLLRGAGGHRARDGGRPAPWCAGPRDHLRRHR